MARAAAEECGLPLNRYLGGPMARIMPVPMVNILNGGAHASNNVDAQEFMVVLIGADSFQDALRMGVEVFHSLKKVLSGMSLSTAVGDEGGFAPQLPSNEAALDVVMQAIEKAGYAPGTDLAIAIDVAASELYQQEKYVFKKGDGSQRTAAEMVELYGKWVERYPIVSIEDGLAEDDWEGWGLLTWKPWATGIQLGGRRPVRHQLLGGSAGHRPGHRQRHPGQAQPDRDRDRDPPVHRAGQGTAPMEWVTPSHRSGGDPEDTFIADLAVATGVGQIKTGSASRRLTGPPSTMSCSGSARSCKSWRTTRARASAAPVTTPPALRW